MKAYEITYNNNGQNITRRIISGKKLTHKNAAAAVADEINKENAWKGEEVGADEISVERVEAINVR